MVNCIGHEHQDTRPAELLALPGACLPPLFAAIPLGPPVVTEIACDHEHGVQGRTSALRILLNQDLQPGRAVAEKWCLALHETLPIVGEADD
jgi:hypothetical protein